MGSRKQLVIFDLELTCWETKEEHLVPEVIEIGAVKVDVKTKTVVDQFTTLVKPKMNPVLSDYCIQLTGIKQEDLKGIGQFPEAYAHFMNWVGTHNKNVLVAWGKDWNDLSRDCRLHEITNRHHQYELIDAKTLFSLKYGRMGLDKAMQLLGQDFTGNRHRGLDDAQATASVILTLFT